MRFWCRHVVTRGIGVALLALLWSAPAWAEIKLYVRTDSTAGGDGSACVTSGATRAYPSLRTAVDAMPSSPTALADQYTIEICNPAGAPEDTTSIASTPWDQITTTAFYILVKTDANNRATTPIDTTRYVLHCTNPATGCLYNNLPNHWRVDGLQIVMTITDGGGYVGLKSSNGNQTGGADLDVRLMNNNVRCDLSGTNGSNIGIETRFPASGASGAGNGYVVNNIVTGCRTGFDNDWAGTKVYNNTAYQNIFSFSTTTLGVYKNNISSGQIGNSEWVGTYDVGDTHNSSTDGTHPTTNGSTCNATYADTALLNLHLQSADTCAKNTGTDNPSGGLFNNDFDDIARVSTWDRGADEYVVTIALTGTSTASITETDVVAGGKTTILTLSGDTWQPTTRGAIEYVGGMGNGFAGTTTAQTITFALTGGLAATPAANDLVVITYFVGSTVDRSLAIRNTSAVDYTLMGSELTQSDTFDANQRTAYRFMPGTPETQFLLTETVGGGTGSTADAGRYTVHVFRGVDSGTPMDVTVVTAGGIDSSAVNPGSITPSTAGAVIYHAGGAASGVGSTMTQTLTKDVRAGSTADTNDASILAGYVEGWTSGAYDPAAYGNIPAGTTANSWTAITAALRPTVTTPFTTNRVALQQGCDSAQAETGGWDAKVKPNVVAGNAVRTSNTVATITWQAQADYDITAQETITCTVPAAILPTNAAVAATPTFTVAVAGGAPAPCRRSLLGVGCLPAPTAGSQTRRSPR